MSDIVTLNGYKIKDEKAVRSYENVAQMKADTKLKEGYHVKTKGYYEANDGGNGEYVIVDDETLVDDGGSIHTLNNGLYAILINNQINNVLQYGCKCDGINDDSSYIQAAIDNSYITNKPVYIPSCKDYIIENSLVLQYKPITIYGDDFRINNSNNNCNITCYTSMFTHINGTSEKRTPIDLKNINVVFYNNKNDRSLNSNYALFKNCTLSNAIIQNVFTYGSGYVIYNGSLKHVSKVINNTFREINYAFICTYNKESVPTTANEHYISDTFITNNWINGNHAMNPVVIDGLTDTEGDCVFENNFFDFFKYIFNTDLTVSGVRNAGKYVNNTFSICFRFTPLPVKLICINNHFVNWNRTSINANFTNQDTFMQNAKVGPFIIDPVDLTYKDDMNTEFRYTKITDNFTFGCDYFIWFVGCYTNSNQFMKNFEESGTKVLDTSATTNPMLYFRQWANSSIANVFNNKCGSQNYNEIEEYDTPRKQHEYNNNTYYYFTNYKNQKSWCDDKLYIAHVSDDDYLYKQISD